MSRGPARALILSLALTCAVARPVQAVPPTPSGLLPDEVRTAIESGLTVAPTPPARTGTSAIQTEWRIPIVRVIYADMGLSHSASALQTALFDTTGANPTGSLSEYWRDVSRGRLRVTGEVVATVVVPGGRNDYANDAWGLNPISTPANSYGLVRDAVFRADPNVDWTRFDVNADGFVDMVWVVHPGRGGEVSGDRRDLYSITSAMASGWSNAGVFETEDRVPGSSLLKMRIDRFTILPELSGFRPGALSEIGVYCHEFGHALGLPDLYDTSSLGGAANSGPGNWSLMSTGTYGGDNRSPESPVHLGGWGMLFLGWAETHTPAQDTTLSLRPLAEGGNLVIQTFEGRSSSEHFLLECRHPVGIDRSIPGSGLLVSLIDEALLGQRIASNRVNAGLTPAMRIIEADGDEDLRRGFNRGDANDPLPGALAVTRLDDLTQPSLRSISNAVWNLAIDDVERVGPGGRDVRMRVQVRAPGWEPEQNLPAPAPLSGLGPARRAAVDPSGRVVKVVNELDGGRPRVRVLERPREGAWTSSDWLSPTGVHAVSPTVALLPGDDLVVAWVDLRDGLGQIRLRTRVRGQWGPEHVMTSSPGGCSAPALAADGRGRVSLAWLELESGRPRLRLLPFLYTAPFGTAMVLSGPLDDPTSPAIARAADGRTVVAWADRSTGPYAVWFTTHHPDSGLSPRLRLTPNQAVSQPFVSIAFDSSGNLHSAWQSINQGASEIHYQRRVRGAGLSPRDTVLETGGDGLQNPDIACDLQHGVHLVFERVIPGEGSQVAYRRWRPSLGWDFRSTTTSTPRMGGVAGPQVLPVSHGRVDVVWTTFEAAGDRLSIRSRRIEGAQAVDVPLPSSRPRPAITLGPNPLLAGRALVATSVGVDPGETIEILDLAGRRVGSARVEPDGRARFPAEQTSRWPAGMLFARSRFGDPGLAGRLVVVR